MNVVENNSFDFVLVRGFNFEIRQPINKSKILIKKGTVTSWDEMVTVLESIKFSKQYNVPVKVSAEAFIGLRNVQTNVVKQFEIGNFNTEKSPSLDDKLNFFVCRGDKPVPTVRDIKKFVNDCRGCVGVFCKNKFCLKDDEPAFFDMTSSPCIRPLNIGESVIYYQDRRYILDVRLTNFFAKPVNLKVENPGINVINSQKERE